MPGVVLINPETNQAETFQPELAQKAAGSGYHVPLVSGEGDLVSVPYDQMQGHIAQGYQLPSEAQLGLLVDKSRFDTPTHTAGAFVRGGLEQLTGGLSGAAEAALGGMSAEDQLKEADFHGTAHALGEATGAAAGIMAGGEGVLAKALPFIPEFNAPALAAKAAKAAAGGIEATGTFGKVAQHMVTGAIDAGAFTASHELGEHLLGDPNSTAEHIAGQIGINAALGAGLGLAFSPALIAMEKAVKPGFIGRAFGRETSVVDRPEGMAEQIAYSGLPEEEKQAVMTGLASKKPNAGEIADAAEALGAPLPEGMTSNSESVQKWDSALTKSPSWLGIKRTQLYREGFDKVNSALDVSLGAPQGMSGVEVGNAVKDNIAETIEAQNAPIKEIYSKMKELGGTVPVQPAHLKRTASAVTKIEGLRAGNGKILSPSSPAWQLAKRVSSEIPNLETVDDLRLYSQRLRQDTIGKPELKFVGSEINRLLEQAADTAVENAAQAVPDLERDGLGISQLLEAHKGAKAGYKALRETMEDVGEAVSMRLRRGEGAQAFLDKLSELPAEKVADRLFTKNNSALLAKFRERFPKSFELLAGLKRQQMREARGAVIDGRLQAGNILRQIHDLSPEIQEMLFSKEALSKINAAKVWTEAVPRNVNPSGTAETRGIFDYFRHPLAMGLTNVGDAAILGAIKGLARISPGEAPKAAALFHTASLVARMGSKIEKDASGIFARGIGAEREGKEKEEKSLALNPKLAEKIEKFQNDPEKLLSHLSDTLAPLSEHLPGTTTAISETAARSIAFLATKLPTKANKLPFDGGMKTAALDEKRFERYASILDKPLSVLGHIKSGTLIPQDIEALATVYPALYSSMKEKTMEKMTHFLTKHEPWELPTSTRLSLSMFLGENLDSSITPQSLTMTQGLLMASEPGPRPPGAPHPPFPRKPGKSGLKSSKLPSILETPSQSAEMRKR